MSFIESREILIISPKRDLLQNGGEEAKDLSVNEVQLNQREAFLFQNDQ